jgi:hypothetical protein
VLIVHAPDFIHREIGGYGDALPRTRPQPSRGERDQTSQGP